MSRNPGTFRRLWLPLLVVALSAVTTAVPATSTPTVDEIVSRYVAARGGMKKIRAVETLREKGRITAGPGREALVTRELKRPGHTRFEITMQGVTGVFVSDGQQGWKMSPFDGDEEPKPLPDQVVEEAAEQGDFEGPLVDWKAKGHLVELAGRESVGGREAYKLKITLKSGAVRHEYLDVKSFQRVRTDSTRQLKGRAVQVQTTYGDYKKVRGVLFPRLIEISAVGRPQQFRVMVDTIEVNPPLGDDRFEMLARPRP